MASDMNELWKEENDRLRTQTQINDVLLRKINLDRSTSEFEKLLKLSILGRNLALVYFVISLSYVIRLIQLPSFCIPVAIGGLLMGWSFYSHRSLKKIDPARMPILELQKAICEFRIHTSQNSKYDIGIVCFWLATLIPAVLYVDFGYTVTSRNIAIGLGLALLVIISGVAIFGFRMYKKHGEQLVKSEELLKQIATFEKRD